MKKSVIVIIFFLLGIYANAQENFTVKQRLDFIPVTTIYPYIGSKILPKEQIPFVKSVALNSADWGNLPIYTWDDIQCTKYTFYDGEDAAFYRKFIPVNKSYIVAPISIGQSDWQRYLLATYTNDGNVIDYIECSVGFYGVGLMLFKQWKIESDMRVTIYQLKPTSSETILFDSPFTSVNAQRIDTEYQIDSTGHFIKKSEKKYKPKNYSRTYLEDEKINIWNGNETLL